MSSVFDVRVREEEKRQVALEIQRRVHGELVEGAPTRFEKHENDHDQ